ncbi:MAG: glucuronate isomerase [Clostridiales bacterium]|nr:glucuronate isomerase [Clostridiales bacterium]
MKAFLDQDFLLSNDTAVTLYHNYASKMPIVDYHCHINPKEIALDRKYDNITQVWLGGDHYKWRLMRSSGVEERYITGDATDWEKFEKWANTLSKAIGNPLYHWSHLELQRYFDYHGVLNKDTAKEVWELCNKKLADTSMSVRSIIKKSNVTHICTTDDPIDTLEWHAQIDQDSTFDVKVLPAWRPDKAMNLENSEYLDYLNILGEVSNVTINDFASLKEAIRQRLKYFNERNCCVSDHAFDYIMYVPASEDKIIEIFQKRLDNQPLSQLEILQFKTAFMLFIGKEYHKLGWVMQLHYGCKRNNNTLAFNKLGPDTGYDAINNYAPSSQMADFLNALNNTDELPKTIIYSLNPTDNATIDSIIGCFQDSSAVGKIQHGSAWWFNDHNVGMRDHMTSLANLGYLAGFVGMLTDSRSFLSYPRHEYFRRILCDLLGCWVENGEYPQDYNSLGEIVQDICYKNAMRYFNF